MTYQVVQISDGQVMEDDVQESQVQEYEDAILNFNILFARPDTRVELRPAA
jgi:hypothetical protein